MFRIIGATVVYGLAFFGLVKAFETRTAKHESSSNDDAAAG